MKNNKLLYIFFIFTFYLLHSCMPEIFRTGIMGNYFIEYSSQYSSRLTPNKREDFKPDIAVVDSFFERHFIADDKMLFNANLEHNGKEYNNSVQIQPEKTGILVKISPPKPGKYKFTIYGKPKGKEGSFPAIYSWYFNVHNLKGVPLKFSGINKFY